MLIMIINNLNNETLPHQDMPKATMMITENVMNLAMM